MIDFPFMKWKLIECQFLASHFKLFQVLVSSVSNSTTLTIPSASNFIFTPQRKNIAADISKGTILLSQFENFLLKCSENHIYDEIC